MKHLQLQLNTDHILPSFEDSLFWSVVAYAKTYELLHMQLWRKKRIGLTDKTVTIDGRQYGVIKHWDIKSPSRNPYNRDNVNDLGLNQLFMGQDPREPYKGDPKDGIYHDHCYIIPKNLTKLSSRIFGDKSKNGTNLLAGVPLYSPMSGWKWAKGTDSENNPIYHYVAEFDDWGVRIVESVEKQTIEDKIYAIITKTDGTIEQIEIQSTTNITYEEVLRTVVTSSNGSPLLNTTWTAGYVPVNKYIEVFGEPIYIEEMSSQAVFAGAIQGKLFVFSKGISLFLAPPQVAGFNIMQGSRQIMPLINLETGQTLMSKINFVDYWDDLFELYVRENQEWWQPLIPFAIIIITTVVTFF